MSVAAGAPMRHRLADRLRQWVERHLPWFDPAAEQARNHASEQLIASSRSARARATRTIRHRNLSDGYREYGQRVRR